MKKTLTFNDYLPEKKEISNDEKVINFIFDHFRSLIMAGAFILTFGTLMFFSVIWIISILAAMAVSMAIDLCFDEGTVLTRGPRAFLVDNQDILIPVFLIGCLIFAFVGFWLLLPFFLNI